MPQQDALGLKHLRDGCEEVVAHRLQAGGKQLRHHPAVVAIDDQGGKAVTLGMDHAIGGSIDGGTSREAGRELLPPPGDVDGPLGALEQAKLDFGPGREECLPHELVPRVIDRHKAGRLGSGRDITAIDPRMTAGPAFCPARRYAGPLTAHPFPLPAAPVVARSGAALRIAEVDMPDLRARTSGVRMDQQADAPRQRARHRDLGRMQQRHDIPAIVLRRPGGEGGIEVAGHRENPAHDVVGLEAVALDQVPQQLVRRLEDLGGVVGGNRRGAANSLQSVVSRSDMATNLAQALQLMLVTDDTLVRGGTSWHWSGRRSRGRHLRPAPAEVCPAGELPRWPGAPAARAHSPHHQRPARRGARHRGSRRAPRPRRRPGSLAVASVPPGIFIGDVGGDDELENRAAADYWGIGPGPRQHQGRCRGGLGAAGSGLRAQAGSPAMRRHRRHPARRMSRRP